MPKIKTVRQDSFHVEINSRSNEEVVRALRDLASSIEGIGTDFMWPQDSNIHPIRLIVDGGERGEEVGSWWFTGEQM